MRKSVLLSLPGIRAYLLLPVALGAAIAIAGCGGGGSSSSSTPGPIGNPNLANITGLVTDTSGNPVSGASIAVPGTSLSATSGTDGKFTIYSVPLASAGFTVTAPSGGGYYNIALYNSLQYDLTVPCPLPLPKPLTAGADSIPGSVELYPTSSPPPPPPTNGVGCPP